MNHLCYLCVVFVMLSRLFMAALWSPARKGLTSWLLFVMFNCDFVTFPCAILGQVWHLIVLIPDLFHLFYFEVIKIVATPMCTNGAPLFADLFCFLDMGEQF